MFSTFSSIQSIINIKNSLPPPTFSILSTSTTNGLGAFNISPLTRISDDGQIVICMCGSGGNGNMYYSSNGGATFSTATIPTLTSQIQRLRMSSTGQYVVFCTTSDKPVYSSDYGHTYAFYSGTGVPTTGIQDIAIADDGNYVIAAGTITFVNTGGLTGTWVNRYSANQSVGCDVTKSNQYMVCDINIGTTSGTQCILSTNSGTSFSNTGSGQETFGRRASIGDGANYMLLGAVGSGSTTGGNLTLYNGSWVKLDSNFTSVNGNSMYMSMSAAGGLMCVSADGSTNDTCKYSQDHGNTWISVASTWSTLASKKMVDVYCSKNGKYLILYPSITANVYIVTWPYTQ